MVHILPRAPVDYVLFMEGRRPGCGRVDPGALIGARLTGRLSEIQLVRAIAGVLLVAAIATGVQAVA
jgi:hypothetical protein